MDENMFVKAGCLMGIFQAMHIQISEATKGIIEKEAPNRFEIAHRGTIAVKGKGDMHTYWLQK